MQLKFRTKLVLALSLVLVAGGLVVATDSVQAAITQGLANLPAQGHVLTCDPVNKSHLLETGGLGFNAVTNGPMVVKFGERFTTSDGRVGAKLSVVDVFSQGRVAGLGDVAFKLDDSRGTGGTYTANKAGSVFPGTQSLEFHLTVDIDGRRYSSVNRAVVVSTNVESLPPAEGTAYTLADDVLLENVDDPKAEPVILRSGLAASF